MNEFSLARDSDRKWVVLGFMGAFALLFSTMAPELTWEHFGEDGGELTLAAAVLGVPHPSGYPLYILLGRLFCFLPAGSFAFRMNLLSVTSGAFAAAACVAILLVVNRRFRLELRPWMVSILGVASFLGYTMWSQCIITEVYALTSALILCTVAALAHFHDASLDRRPSGRFLWLASLLWGLALGVHLTGVFLGLGFFMILFSTEKTPWRRSAFWYGALTCLGLAVLLYGLLPILATRNVPVNWGMIRNGSDLWKHISGSQYRYRMFVFTGRELAGRLSDTLVPLFVSQWGRGGALLSALGAVWGLWLTTFGGTAESRRYARRLGLGWILLWFPQAFYSLNYNINDLPVYFALSFVFIGQLFPFGVAAIGRLALFFGLGRTVPSMLVVASAIVPCLGLSNNFGKLDLRHDTVAGEFGRMVFRGIPHGSLILSDFDGRTNSMLYERWLGSGQDSEVIVVLRTMLASGWYREHLRRLYPEIVLPEPGAEYLRASWDMLCDYVGERILRENASRTRFIVRDTIPFTQAWDLVMANGLFRLEEKTGKPPPRPEKFWPIELAPYGNSDYRGDPFLPGIRSNDSPHFPSLGQGEIRSENGVPFWLSAPSGRSGQPSAITTCYSRHFLARIPLLASPSSGLHLALEGGVNREASGSLAFVQPWYKDGPGKNFPLADLPDFRDAKDGGIRYIKVPLDFDRLPEAVEIRSGNAVTQEPYVPGVALFGITQELLPASSALRAVTSQKVGAPAPSRHAK